MHELPDFGALVISLDFELHWGVRDHEATDGPYRANLLGVWDVIPRMLDLFEERTISATWATVGMLFADDRTEQAAFAPSIRPTYADVRLDPYHQTVGFNEIDDPLHFAPSLVARIRERPGQEIGTHTFSHFYCLEPGQTSEQFAADIDAAVAIAAAKGVRLRSIALPRNQVSPAYEGILRDAGIDCYRGYQPTWMHRPGPGSASTPWRRGARLLHEHIGPGQIHLTAWSEVLRPSGLYDVPASLFVRGYSPSRRLIERMRLDRIRGALRAAARSHRIVHLWWHPHNFGIHIDENLRMLGAIFDELDRLRDEHGMRSMSMGDVARLLDGRDD